MPIARPGRRPRRSCFIFALALLAAFQTAPPVWAWGRLGHRVIARLTERHMTPEAMTGVAALLESGEPMADASLWAEMHGDRKTAPWHYVDVPLDESECDPKWSADDPKHGCVVDNVNEFYNVVGDRSKPVEERRLALRFLLHCVQDMHQPCHVGDNHDRGGNDTQIRFFDRGSNMHRLWDSDLIEWNTNSEDIWLAELAELNTAENRAAWMRGTVEDWATESLLAARAAYVVPGTDARIKPGQKLAREYYDAHLPVVQRRLCQAGLRLAMVLNEVWPKKRPVESERPLMGLSLSLSNSRRLAIAASNGTRPVSR